MNKVLKQGTVGLILGGVCALPIVASAGPKPAPKPAVVVRVDFNRDVRPILSENCFACHGFDANKRQAGLRLDIPEGAYKKTASGKAPVAPGNLGASELYRRVTATGPLHMPPASTGKTLTAKQIATLKQWIAQGGKYAAHWAYIPPKRPPLPPVKNAAWVRNPIDRFILARLEKEGLTPSPEADKATLLRRVTLDLTGLPPTLAELDAFLADKSPKAYEKVVDRLLASPHYGERMALKWLDLARYADTHGYHIDSQRDMWRWRDWVIEAYNNNMPFDQFTVEQLAGDLLPNATLSQKIATGFNRNHPINFEGGAIPEEYLTNYIADRIDTTATTWMALTLRCTQCHDHKFDPFKQKDYYRFYAYFHNVPENGLDGQSGNAAPFLKAPTPEQQAQLDSFDKKIAEVEQAMKTRAAEAAPAVDAWIKTASANQDKNPSVSVGLAAHYALDETSGEQAHGVGANVAVGVVRGKAEWVDGKNGKALRFDGKTYVDLGQTANFDRGDKFSYGAWIYPTGQGHMTVLSHMDDSADFRGWDLYLGEQQVYAHIVNKWDSNALRVNTRAKIELNKWTHLFVTYDGSSKAAGAKIYVNGKPAELERTHDTLRDTIRTDKSLNIGRRNPAAPFEGLIDDVRIYSRELLGAEVEELAGFDTLHKILATPEEKRTQEQKDTLSKFYLESQDEPYRKLNAELADWRKKRSDLDNTIPTTMVMQEMEKPRDTFILLRGQYDKPGEKVTAGVPETLPPLPPGAPNNRLGLARWLVDPSHPLTARVAVNRFWQMVFGTGIVKTVENFGVQGDWPSHPELLDWLATEFIRSGWNVKGMMRLLVTSATYRQSSKATPVLLAKDPENLLLARAPRIRLTAEFIRDQALALSGLLVDKIGGPSVKPYHPAGLWEELAFGGGFSAQKYEQDHGEKLYRRGMYTFWKRTCPPPTLQTFDAPEREFCMVRRSVTNTPLQALALMNDPTYVEASRKFAERLLTERPTAMPQERLRLAYRMAMARSPLPQEIKVLVGVYQQQLALYRQDKAAAMKLLSVGESKRDEKLDTAELAAWTSVASMILNLDETITKG